MTPSLAPATAEWDMHAEYRRHFLDQDYDDVTVGQMVRERDETERQAKIAELTRRVNAIVVQEIERRTGIVGIRIGNCLMFMVVCPVTE